MYVVSFEIVTRTPAFDIAMALSLSAAGFAAMSRDRCDCGCQDQQGRWQYPVFREERHGQFPLLRVGGGASPGVFPRSPTCVDFSHVTDQGQATPDRLPSQRRLRRLGQFNAVHQVAAELMPRVHRQRVLGGHNGLVAAAGKPLRSGQAIEDFHRRLVAAGGRRETFHAVVVAAQGRIGQPEQIEHLLRFLGRRVGVGEALQGLQGLLRLARLPMSSATSKRICWSCGT